MNEIIVAAIDFGTTYSGYAYSFRDEYARDPLKIYANNDWNDGSGLITPKAPTVVLFDNKGEFHSFGYEAEQTYTDLAENNKHHGWRYFRRFKMELFKSKRIKRDKRIDDDQGNSTLALDVFAASIRYLKEHLFSRLRDRIQSIKTTDIHWVLTVPAIWTDGAKQFMIEAAAKAGIPGKQLTLAYEPEAAAIYCNEVKMNKAKEKGVAPMLQTLRPGSRFMVLDLGGGTVDVTVHEVQADGTLDTISPPSGGPWGGTRVDEHFHRLLENLFGRDIMLEFSKQCKSDKLDLDRMLEVKKREVKLSRETDVLRLPIGLYETYDDLKPATFAESLKRSSFGQSIQKTRDKLKIDNKYMVGLFHESKENIIKHIGSILGRPELRRVKTLVMVGGLSESQIIRQAVKDAFPESQGYNVVCPEQGGTAILKGAVMYGHNTDSIRSRKMRYSYGISTAVPFDETRHTVIHKVRSSDNVEKCEDIFKPFVRIGEIIASDQIVQHVFNPPNTTNKNVEIEIYRSTSENTMYINEEGCQRIGTLRLELTGPTDGQRAPIDVGMKFGGTQISVVARERGAVAIVRSQFDFMH